MNARRRLLWIGAVLLPTTLLLHAGAVRAD